MSDRDDVIGMMSNMLARRDWERIREQDNFRIRAWEAMDHETRDAWAKTRREDAERFVSLLVPFVLRSTAKEWHWNNVDVALRGLAGYYETGEYADE